MKLFSKNYLYLLVLCVLTASCKKQEIEGVGTFTSSEYTFNRATKGFTPDAEVKAEISSTTGVKFVYCYLVRTNAPDSLIFVGNTSSDIPDTYSLSIPVTSFPSKMDAVTGVKVLAKEANNNSVEGFIKITYYDPALPAFANFPTTINADLTGGNTSLTGSITSESGLAKIEIYDDYQVENTYVLASTITNLNNSKSYALNYSFKYRKAAQHVKIVATDIYGQTNNLVVAMPVDLEIFKPKFLNFATSLDPVVDGNTAVSGKITSVTGLKEVKIYDDYKGSYELVSTIANLNGNKDYTLNHNYSFRMRAENIKIVAIDTDDLQSEKIIKLDYDYKSKIYRDVVMTAHTTGTNTIFFEQTGTTSGNCSLNASESTMAFIYYGVSSGPSFYAPTNTGTIAVNMKCNGAGWVIANSASLRATRFRVLVPGSSTGVDNIYTQFNANKIDNIDDAFFTANGLNAATGNTARFDPNTAAATTGIFNATAAYLIQVRIPDVSEPTKIFKNALIRVKEATFPTGSSGTSTIKFDIIVQK